MSTIDSRSLSQSFDDCRSIGFLNDFKVSGGAVYTDSVLLPVAAFTIGEVQNKFAKFGIPSHESTDSSLSYTANATSINVSSLTDLEEPLEVWQMQPGGAQLWFPLNRVSEVGPTQAPSPTYLTDWEWREQVLRVLPATQTMNIFIRYRKVLAYPTDAGTDTTGGSRYYWAVVAGTSLRAARGTERYDQLALIKTDYDAALWDAIEIQLKDRQSISTRQVSSRQGSGWDIPRVVGP